MSILLRALLKAKSYTRVPKCQLITGKPHSGKATLAWAFSKTILGTSPIVFNEMNSDTLKQLLKVLDNVGNVTSVLIRDIQNCSKAVLSSLLKNT